MILKVCSIVEFRDLFAANYISSEFMSARNLRRTSSCQKFTCAEAFFGNLKFGENRFAMGFYPFLPNSSAGN